MPKQEGIKWCPQHGYPEPCPKCNWMPKEWWDEFYESLARAVEPSVEGESEEKQGTS